MAASRSNPRNVVYIDVEEGNLTASTHSNVDIAHARDDFADLNVTAPSRMSGREVTSVEDYDSQFMCPGCDMWRASCEAKVVKVCGHVQCQICWTEWADARGRGPPHDRYTTCIVCRAEVKVSDTTEVDFRSARAMDEDQVARAMVDRRNKLNDDNEFFKRRLPELREVIKTKEAHLIIMRKQLEDIAKITGDMSAMAIDN
ncbi:hypothetical protein FS749_000803 [Ceratobasidium sp. UAMH 11750]|nr:hypothetical protein FS749_000803 [Ceratobasidium sp. UAMH 11750]